MPRNKVLYTLSETFTDAVNSVNGTAIPIGGLGIQTGSTILTYTNTTPSAKTFTSGTGNVSDTTVVAELGNKEVTDITCVADVAGSLNSKFFNYETVNLGGASVNLRYVWFNVNGAGVNPSPAGRTGIMVSLATGANNGAVATALRAAMAADTLVTISGATVHCIITNNYMGNVTNAANGTASPGFSYSVTTAGVSSNLNNTYFTFSNTGNVNNFAAWYNVNGEGTAPVIVGSPTLIVIAIAANTVNTTVASTSRTAITTAAPSGITVSGATTHVILTNTPGTSDATANGAVSPGFSIVNTPGALSGAVSLVNSTITLTNHGFPTGLTVRLSGGTLPAPFATLTSYYVIVVDADTIKLASTYALALAGTAITITSYGSSGTTFSCTPTALSSAIVIEVSDDPLDSTPTHWDLTSGVAGVNAAVGVLTGAFLTVPATSISANWMRFSFNSGNGRMSGVSRIVLKGLD